jgi:spore coat polysaccharide biosynthesis predicted glycosyltransferase SpsG
VLNASPAAEESVYLSLKRRDETRLLLGPAYALLRGEFRHWRPQVKFREKVRNILFTFGGGDDRGATVFCLDATKSLDPAIERVVLVSSPNPHTLDIMDWVDRNNSLIVKLFLDELAIARCMVGADLAIIAGGTTTFEAAAMGLPSLIVQLTDNQAANAMAWEKRGAALNLGRLEDLSTGVIKSQIESLIVHPEVRREMARAGLTSVDGSGSERVAQILRR